MPVAVIAVSESFSPFRKNSPLFWAELYALRKEPIVVGEEEKLEYADSEPALYSNPPPALNPST